MARDLVVVGGVRLSEDFISERAFERWTYEGVECAMVVAPLGHACNAYVRLPETHVDRGRDWDALKGVYTAAHMGLTYGCDAYGWIGFDTAHYCDEWPADEMLALLTPGSREHQAFQTMQKAKTETRQKMLEEGWLDLDKFSNKHHHTWTVDLLRDVTNELASQVAEWMRMQEAVRR